jgi:DNA-binding GntR family transcriptional regulator
MPALERLTTAGNRPEGLQDFASRQIVRAILTGAFGPGEKLSPTKLADELRISHIPVREALASLESSGHVVRVPRVGFFVAELSWDYIEDVYHWRQVLEDEAHRMAMPKLDDGDIARMRKLNQASTRTTKYSEKYLNTNREFHFVAFERAGSEALLNFLNRLWDASSRYQNVMSAVAVPRSLLRHQHDGLIEAFEARDVELVNARMAEHRGVTLTAIREIVERLAVGGEIA